MNFHDKQFTLDALREPLSCIPNVDRDIWLKVGMGLHAQSGGSEQGYAVWDGWSQGAENYDARDQRTTWNGFKLKEGGLSAGTIIHLAKAHGWRGSEPRTAQPSKPAQKDAAPTLYDVVAKQLEARGFRKVATYSYGAAGWKDRWEHPTDDKQFRWYHADENGELMSGKVRGAKVPPHGLARALEHVDQLVFVAEGEKCADLLNSLGLVAISIEDGHAATAAEMLPGRRFAVLVDNDAPGEARAKKAAAALEKAGDATIVRLPGLKEPGDDVEQWLEIEGNTPAKLYALAGEVKQVEANNLLACVTYSRDVKLSDRGRYLIDEVMPAEGIGFLYGGSTAGKSFVAEHMAMSIARGAPFAGRYEVEDKGFVVYLAIEAPQTVRDRHLGHLQHVGQNAADIAFVDYPLNLADPKSVQGLVAILQAVEKDTRQRIRLIIIDTVARAIPGLDEDAAKDAGKAIVGMEAIRQALNTVVMGVHHTGKNVDNGMRGSSALFGAADFVIEVRDGQLNLEKLKIGKGRQNIAQFSIRPYLIGLDHKGRDIDAGLLEWSAHARPKRRERPKNARAEQGLQVLENLLIDRRVVPQPIPGVPHGVAEAVEWKVWREACRAKGLFVELQNDRTEMRRVRDTLEKLGWIGFTEDHVWFIQKPLEVSR